MADIYYLCTKDIGDGPHLIGKLEKLSEDEYQFQYMINADKFPEWFIYIPEMDNIHKVYKKDDTWKYIIRRMVPEKDTFQSKVFEEQFNLSSKDYNEWKYLELAIDFYDTVKGDKFPLCDSHEIMYFYKELPKKVHRYD